MRINGVVVCGWVVGVLVGGAVLWGQTTGTAGTLPADPVARSKVIDQQMKELWEKNELYGEWKELSDKATAVTEKARRESAEYYLKLEEIYKKPVYKKYSEERNRLEDLRNETWREERKKAAEGAKAIYSARHAELLKGAAAGLVKAKELGFDVLSFPKLDGSTSTQPLNTIIAARILGVPYQWFYPEPYGTIYHESPKIPSRTAGLMVMMPGRYYFDKEAADFMMPSAAVMASPPENSPKAQDRIAMLINGFVAKNASTHNAYVNVIEGRADLNINARLPSESEKKLAADKGVKLVCVPIAKDALVFIVNKKNGVKSLTLEQIRDVYTDRYRTWTDLAAGKKSEPLGAEAERGEGAIHALWRERDSGSRELFDSLVTPGKALPDPKRMRELYSNSMSGVYNALHEDANGLAYSVYYYEHFQALSAYTRTVAIEGFEPTPENIGNGKYPLVAAVYAVYREGEKADSGTMKLVNYLLSEEGQGLVRESGYVPVK